nr:hypothetical protein [Tanacetum cinerariifolium]
MTSEREITPPPDFLAVPTTTTMFAATTPANTPLAYHASTSTNPNPVISPTFMEANYETFKSLLRDRRRQMHNNDLRTELEYFSEDYDEEREMKPRPRPARAPMGFLSQTLMGNPSIGEASPTSHKEGTYHRPLQTPMYTFPNMLAYANPNSTGLFLNPLGLVTPFVCLIEDCPLPDGLKMPSHIGSYDGKGDPDNFLHLFEGAIRMQKWLMPVACHMFTYTLKDSARIWWNSHVASLIRKISKQSSDHTLANRRSSQRHIWLCITSNRGKTKASEPSLPNIQMIPCRFWACTKTDKSSVLFMVKDKKEDCTAKNSVSESMAYKEGIMFPPVTRVSNAPVIIEAAVFRRKVGRVYMDSGSTCEATTKSKRRKEMKTKQHSLYGNKSFAVGKCHLALKMQGQHIKCWWIKSSSNKSQGTSKPMLITWSSKAQKGMLSDIHETFERFRSINMNLNPKKCSFGVEEGLYLGHLINKQGIKANPSKIKAATKLEQPRALKDIQSLNEKQDALSRFLSKGAERSLPFFKVLKSCKGKKKIHWTDEANKAFKEMKKFVQALPKLTTPRAGETLIMYLAASKENINAALFAKRSERQIPIYFIRRVLQRAELNYHALEKPILALMHAARRLRRYFQAHTIMVLTVTPIKQALTRLEKTGRVDKWAIELGEHDIVFLKRDERERQTDFLPEIPFDDRKEYTYAIRFKFETNNKAEYEALLAGLCIAQETEITKVAIFLDSQLVGFKGYTVEHVRRSQNKKAKALSKLALMTFEHLTKEVLVEVLAKRSIEEKEVPKVEIKEKRSWMSPIQEYLLSGLLPEDTKEARKIMIQAPQYKLI